jgi:hypothetical protein
MERRFSEEEMRAVFARAAERQRRVEETTARAGLSLAEMQEVAAAAGIDPTHVAAAVAELGAAPDPRRTFMGAPVEVTRVRRLPAPVSDETWARIVREVRRAFNDDGVPSQLGRIREWSSIGRGARRDLATRLAIEPDGDGARVTIRQSTRDFAFGFTLAGGIQAVMAVVFSLIATFSGDPELWIPAGIMGGMALAFLTAVQVGMRVWAQRQERKFEAVLDRIELVVREDAPPTAAPARAAERPVTTPRAEPRVDLDALDAPEAEAPTAERRRERT